LCFCEAKPSSKSEFVSYYESEVSLLYLTLQLHHESELNSALVRSDGVVSSLVSMSMVKEAITKQKKKCSRGVH